MPRLVTRFGRKRYTYRKRSSKYSRAKLGSRKRFKRAYGRSAVKRGRSVATKTGFNAPLPRTHWKKRWTTIQHRGTKQLASIATDAETNLFIRGLNVVPDDPNTATFVGALAGYDNFALNASLGNRVAVYQPGTGIPANIANHWAWGHLDGTNTNIPFNQDCVPGAVDHTETAQGGMVGIYIYKFNPVKMTNWAQIKAEWNWIRFLGMEVIITPNWRSRYNTGTQRAPDPQTRMSMMTQTGGVIDDGIPPFEPNGTAQGFLNNLSSRRQPLNCELYVKKFNSFDQGGAGRDFPNCSKMLENGIRPINMENGRKVSIKIKPTSWLRTYVGSAADFETAKHDYVKTSAQWHTTDQVDDTFSDPDNNPALATIGLMLKNVPVHTIEIQAAGTGIGVRTLSEAPAPTLHKQIAYAGAKIVYHYLVRGAKRPFA